MYFFVSALFSFGLIFTNRFISSFTDAEFIGSCILLAAGLIGTSLSEEE